jgi:hypothetical protein
MRDAFSAAVQRSVGVDALTSVNRLLSALEAFDVEDDGSDEWSYMIDLIEMISPVIQGASISVCVETALRVYLETMFNHRARVYGDAAGRPISVAEAKERMADDPEWGKVIDFVGSLLFCPVR